MDYYEKKGKLSNTDQKADYYYDWKAYDLLWEQNRDAYYDRRDDENDLIGNFLRDINCCLEFSEPSKCKQYI